MVYFTGSLSFQETPFIFLQAFGNVVRRHNVLYGRGGPSFKGLKAMCFTDKPPLQEAWFIVLQAFMSAKKSYVSRKLGEFMFLTLSHLSFRNSHSSQHLSGGPGAFFLYGPFKAPHESPLSRYAYHTPRLLSLSRLYLPFPSVWGCAALSP